jgi:pimeloyl-ACP methyl ester carboxylesterase
VVRVDGWAEAIGRASWTLRSDCATQADARRNAATLSLVGVAQRITCATFIMNGRLDRIVPCRDVEGLREVRGPVEFVIIKDSNHVANNAPNPWRLFGADWMAEQLRAAA